ncbi:VapE domain-containing protein [Xanthocytophaga flava]|uniref:VapE domain-containing protein n=1 Tax=Xanthocytophaga flava TaxID=3048013 RepID=UPI0028D8A6F9|nr:VapE domain-containing protein [Xanthocytophaga flavus]MDJ1473153.1 VapE family protein [Xanthocytophaga flavus]
MKSTPITLFTNAYDKKGQAYSLDIFLENIRQGLWQDEVLALRTCKEEAARKKRKNALPAVTIAGVFEGGKSDRNLKVHSDHIAIDLDHIDNLPQVKACLEADPYTRAVFVSCGGQGLCVVVPIDGKRHEQAFDGLRQYYFQTYNLIVDPSGRNLGRLRFVSFDPDLIQNLDAQVFKIYPEREKRKPDTRQIFFGRHDLDHVFDQIHSRQIDITGNYLQWCAIGFALADYYGEAGRERFISISSYSALYDPRVAEEQFTACLKHNAHATRKVTIASFLWHCRQHDISITTDKTRTIVASATMGRNGHNTVEGTVKALQDFDGIDPEMSRPIVEQVYASKDASEEKVPLVVRLEKYWKEYQATVRRNVINKKCYKGAEPLTEKSLMDIYMDASKKLHTNVPKDMVADVLKSSLVPEFNPIREFFEGMAHPTAGHIRRLAECLNCKQGVDYADHILTKWLIGCVASAFGKPSSVMLTLCGEQGKGKSHFFLNLLPESFTFRDELVSEDCFKKADSHNNKLMMITRWIAIDEEFNSIENIGENALKSHITQKNVTIRYAYERVPDTLPRLCNFVGTTNEQTFLKDQTGNRRFPIIETDLIDQEKYNAIDKYELWKEAYFIYLQNPDVTFDANDFVLINTVAENYIQRTPEQELLLKFYEEADEATGIFRSTSEILNTIQGATHIRNLNTINLGKAISALKWKKTTLGHGKQKRHGYYVHECLQQAVA